jgi:hypothetical protein
MAPNPTQIPTGLEPDPDSYRKLIRSLVMVLLLLLCAALLLALGQCARQREQSSQTAGRWGASKSSAVCQAPSGPAEWTSM